MKKKLLIVAIVVIAIIAIFAITATSSSSDTFLESRVKYAMKYTKQNYDELDETKTGQELVDAQNASIDAIKEAYEAGDYSLENPYVAVDPYLQNNLAAYIIFPTEEAVTYSYTVEAKEGNSYPFSYTSETTQNGDVVIPVVGLYEDYANQVSVTITNAAGEEQTSTVEVQTEKSESKYAEGSSNATEMEKEAGMTMTEEQAAGFGTAMIDVTDATVRTKIYDDSVLDSVDGFILSEDYDIYDYDGNLRFSSVQGAGNNALKFDDGRYLVVSSNHLMYDMDLMGKVHNFYFAPVSDENGEQLVLHHDTVVSPDGKYIYALAGYVRLDDIKENREQYHSETLILKFDRKSGEAVDVFDYADDFADELQSLPAGSEDDPLHMNSIDYYEDKDQLIVSMKNQSLIMGANAKNGKVEWILKDPAAIAKEENKELLLEAKGDVEYTSGNHTAFVMNTDKYNSEGDDLYLSVFDNKFCVNDDQTPAWSAIGETITCGKSENSSMVIFHINLADKTVETLEEIVAEEGRWSYIRSSVFTDLDGIYQMNYADMMGDDGSPITHSDLYIMDESGKVLAQTTYDGMTNIYRSRIINQDEVGTSLEANLESL